MLTPAITASSVSPPLLTISIALAQQLTPPLLRLALEMTMFRGLPCDAAGRTSGSTAAPAIAARLVNRLCIGKFSFRRGARKRPLFPDNSAKSKRRGYEGNHIMSQEQAETILRGPDAPVFALYPCASRH